MTEVKCKHGIDFWAHEIISKGAQQRMQKYSTAEDAEIYSTLFKYKLDAPIY